MLERRDITHHAPDGRVIARVPAEQRALLGAFAGEIAERRGEIRRALYGPDARERVDRPAGVALRRQRLHDRRPIALGFLALEALREIFAHRRARDPTRHRRGGRGQRGIGGQRNRALPE